MTHLRPYKLLIFDWDGTLMDSIARIVDCLKVASLDVLNKNEHDDHTFKDVIGLGLYEALSQIHPQSSAQEIEDMSSVYRQQYMHLNTTDSKLFNGAENVLAELKAQNYQLAIATGKSRQGLEQTLTTTNLGTYFDITRCASETLSKPHPKMLEDILFELKLNPDEALMIGDTEYDMEMAQNANMDRLGVSYGVHPRSRLNKHTPIGILDNITELNHFLSQIQTHN